uniref:Piwi domain-containing protein n=1 Tax=Strongyloides stercoralis TaxID=6248 RepID=A0A0K0DSJ6_STRER
MESSQGKSSSPKRGGASNPRGRGRGGASNPRGRGKKDKEIPPPEDTSIIEISSQLKNIGSIGSDSSHVINRNSLTTVENPNFKCYRIREKEQLTIGKDIPLVTNVYNFKLKENIYVDLFRVHFLNAKKELDENFKKSRKRDVVMKVLSEAKNKFDIKNFVFDDANLLYVTSGVMTEQRYEYCLDPDAKKVVYVRFEKTKSLLIKLSNVDNVSYTESKTFLNLMITQFAKIPFLESYNKQCTGIGNTLFFKPPETKSDNYSLDFLRQIWSGLCFSISLGPRGLPILNINQSFGVFPKLTLTAIDFYCEANGVQRNTLKLEKMTMNENQRARMTALLKGLNLSVDYNKSREFTIYSVIDKIASKTVIEIDDKKTTIPNYFKERYNIQLKYPDLPLIQMNPEAAKIYIPMELVKISDKPQRLKQKLEPYLTSKMVKCCTKLPGDKFSEVNSYLENIKKDGDVILKKFGTDIGNQIQTVGKILPAIKVKLPADPQKRTVYDEKLKNFTYGVVFVNRPDAPNKYNSYIDKIKFIISNVKKYGCNFASDLPSYKHEFNTKDNLSNILKKELDKLTTKKNHLVIFVIRENCTSYGSLKMYCEQKEYLGCHSQVLKTKTLFKVNPSNPRCRVTLNIAIKINGKLGGLSKDLIYEENDPKLNEFKKKFFNKNDATIYIGADVIHPAPQDVGKNSIPSISAVVGSMDILGFKYAVSGKVHTETINQNKQAMETLQFFNEQIKERITSFKNSTNTVPKHIVVFRDGVADSQFKITMDHEVSAIHKVCESINKNYKPTITFLVIQKRHGVRFLDPKKSSDKFFNGNVPPNTVITKDIINPELLDLYVVPHKGSLGTSKPCHVYALYDDWKLSLDEISLLICWMANICTRCPDPIGIPTPCYYADLACTRLKHHYIEKKELLERSKSKSNITIDIHPSIRDEQFFV